jgi:hypothetical protein
LIVRIYIQIFCYNFGFLLYENAYLLIFGFSSLKDVASNCHYLSCFLVKDFLFNCQCFFVFFCQEFSFLIVNVCRVFLSRISVNLEFWVFLSSFSHRLTWCHLSSLIVLSSEIFWVFLFIISRLFNLSLESLVMFIVCLSRPLGLI